LDTKQTLIIGGDNAVASNSFNLKSGNIKPCDRQEIKASHKTWLPSAFPAKPLLFYRLFNRCHHGISACRYLFSHITHYLNDSSDATRPFGLVTGAVVAVEVFEEQD